MPCHGYRDGIVQALNLDPCEQWRTLLLFAVLSITLGFFATLDQDRQAPRDGRWE